MTFTITYTIEHDTGQVETRTLTYERKFSWIKSLRGLRNDMFTGKVIKKLIGQGTYKIIAVEGVK